MEDYFKYSKKNGFTVIEICNEKLNLFNTPDVLNNLEDILKELNYPDVIIDLKNVTHIDSVGIGFLIASKNLCNRNNSEIILVSDNEVVLKVLDITKMRNFFTIFSSVEESGKYFENKQ